MATIEIYESTVLKEEIFICVFCNLQIINNTHCIPCNDYKGAVTLAEYFKITGAYPKLRLVN